MDPENPLVEGIDEAVEVMASGGIVLYPTDTLYGLGVNALDDVAVDLLYSVKGRDYGKPTSICLPGVAHVREVAYLNQKNMEVLNTHLPGPYTFIVPKKPIISDKLTASKSGIGIRVPNNKIAKTLSQKFPITTSSANISQMPTHTKPQKILKQIKKQIDLTIDIGPLNNGESTVINLTQKKPKIIRQGTAKFPLIKNDP